eukprot:3128892-Prymnesium_polylepis.1
MLQLALPLPDGAARMVWLADAVWLEGADAPLADVLALPNLAGAAGYSEARPLIVDVLGVRCALRVSELTEALELLSTAVSAFEGEAPSDVVPDAPNATQAAALRRLAQPSDDAAEALHSLCGRVYEQLLASVVTGTGDHISHEARVLDADFYEKPHIFVPCARSDVRREGEGGGVAQLIHDAALRATGQFSTSEEVRRLPATPRHIGHGRQRGAHTLRARVAGLLDGSRRRGGGARGSRRAACARAALRQQPAPLLPPCAARRR